MSERYFDKKTMRDVPLSETTVLLRADYNVPLTETGEIADDYRIASSLSTLNYLKEQKCRVVIISHLGRPEGVDAKFSLEPVAVRLQELLGSPVTFVPASIGDKVKVASKAMKQGDVVLLENLRFHEQEEANDEHFARALAVDSLAQYFVQDGFGVVHRAHASTAAITQFLPSVGGALLEREYDTILGAMKRPARPLTAVLGGAKIADKIEVIDAFVDIADQIVIGGAMANTFLQYKGLNIGKSKVEADQKDILDRIYQNAVDKVGHDKVDQFVLLPTDVAVAQSVDEKAKRREVKADQVGDEDIILDIGSHTAHEIAKHIGAHGTVVWNGTLGYAELQQFSYGSARLALHLAKHTHVTSIVGGGDTADFVLGWDKRKGKSFSHISTGGGASLELMSGKKLPGVEALLN